MSQTDHGAKFRATSGWQEMKKGGQERIEIEFLNLAAAPGSQSYGSLDITGATVHLNRPDGTKGYLEFDRFMKKVIEDLPWRPNP